MKPLPIIIPLIFVAFSAFGQTLPDSGFTNKAEAKLDTADYYVADGKWITYIESDGEFAGADTTAPYYILTIYKDGKIYGLEREYYKSGKIRRVIPYSNGNMNGTEKAYYENGIIKFMKVWMDNNLKSAIFYDSTGNEIK
jgi:hypothetical protein